MGAEIRKTPYCFKIFLFIIIFLSWYITVPTGYAVFPHEGIIQPEELMRITYNITSYTEIKAGGHFAALEEPKLLLGDIIKFVKTIQLD